MKHLLFLILLSTFGCSPEKESIHKKSTEKLQTEQLVTASEKADTTKVEIDTVQEKKALPTTIDSIKYYMEALHGIDGYFRSFDYNLKFEQQGKYTYDVYVSLPNLRRRMTYQFKQDSLKGELKVVNGFTNELMPANKWLHLLKSNQWAELQYMFPVYSFKEFTAIIYLNDARVNLVLEKQLEGSGIKGELKRTSHEGGFYRMPDLQSKLLNNKSMFTILCTKGIVKRSPHAITMSEHECFSQMLALEIAPIDTLKYGYPVLAVYDTVVQWQTASFPQLEDSIWQQDSLAHFEYRDKERALSIGKLGAYSILSKDNFTNTSRFPTRYIYRNDTLVQMYPFDFFGIPCD